MCILKMTTDDDRIAGVVTNSWLCVDCGVNTAPQCPPGPIAILDLKSGDTYSGVSHSTIDAETEMYMVTKAVWKKSGVADMGGCLCIGCLEQRLGRKLTPMDFDWEHPFNRLPGTPRLLSRRGG
jgi:hypothetical protein